MGETISKAAFEICVVTVDFVGNGLGPGINMVMFDNKNNQSPVIALDHIFQNELDYHQAKFTIDQQPWSRPKVFVFMKFMPLYYLFFKMNNLILSTFCS